MSAHGGMRRIACTAVALGLALALGLVLLVAKALASLERERRLDQRMLAERLFDESERRLTALIEREEARPFAHYRYFYVPENQVAGSLALNCSPLAAIPQEAELVGHFQIDPDGSFHTPLAPRNEELARLATSWMPSPDLAQVRLRLAAATTWLQTPAPAPEGAPDQPAEPLVVALPAAAAPRAAAIDPEQVQVASSSYGSYGSRAQRQAKTSKVPAQSLYNFQQEDARDNVLQQSLINAREGKDAPAASYQEVNGQINRVLGTGGDDAQLDVSITPLRGRLADSGDLVLFRTVRAAGRSYRQGLVLRAERLGARIAAEVLEAEGLGTSAGLRWSAAASQPASASDQDGVFHHRFAEPFHELAATALIGTPPGQDGAGRRYVLLLAAAVAAAGAVGIVALYRMSAVVVQFAQRRSDFVAAVSHELKTPLTSIRLYAEMLHAGMVPDEERRREHYATITAESERLSRLINNVLELARLERGDRPVERRVGEVGGVLDEVVRVVEPHARAAGFALAIERADGLPPVAFDRDALLQVMINLVDNAIKFSRGAERRRIVLAVSRAGDGVRIVVADSGPGVPPQQLMRIFEPFYRGERELTRTTTGTGLGLSLAKGLIEGMGGAIAARNRAQGGFEVEIVLPLPA